MADNLSSNPVATRGELYKIAAELARGLHGDVVFSKSTPWYVRERVRKVIDDADEAGRLLAIRLRAVNALARSGLGLWIPLTKSGSPT